MLRFLRSDLRRRKLGFDLGFVTAANCIELFSPDAGRTTTRLSRDDVVVPIRLSRVGDDGDIGKARGVDRACGSVRVMAASSVLSKDVAARILTASTMVVGNGSGGLSWPPDLMLETWVQIVGSDMESIVMDPLLSRGHQVQRMGLADDCRVGRGWKIKTPTTSSVVVRLPPWPAGVVVAVGIGQPIGFWASRIWVGAQAFGPGPWFSMVVWVWASRGWIGVQAFGPGSWFCVDLVGLFDGSGCCYSPCKGNYV